MSDADEVLRAIDQALATVKRGLNGLSAAETNDIIEELRSHIVDRAREAGELTPQTVSQAIDGLGDLRELAGAYAAERITSQVERRRSPLWMLGAAARLATLSVGGFVLFLVSFTGYGTGISFVLTALLKPFFPDRTGLWVSGSGSTFSMHLGFDTRPVVGHELLGWWVIPVCLAAGGVILWLTWRLDLAALRGVRKRAAARTAI
jgi:uncharacterized membrane protein